MKVRYDNTTNSVDWQQVSELFKSVGWAERTPEQLKKAFNASSFKYFAYHETELIGVGRTVDDGCFYAWIVDLAIHPKYQDLKIGKTILSKLETNLSSYITTMLTAAPGKSGFYEKLGWEKQRSAYIFPRSEEQLKEFVFPE
ncbi:GNAT family N-acetyltransferase [Pseudoalteromonas luteoviolacea]|uniref:N-acetyltransferase domain-containing protein n=1 Tax=Pseudoalteromonas luteoviolacea S4054 TaxID=1129367 RepID=A0A0F6AGD1_9GAMM|nr:GNAT family N-acetyltransferase [Pseudoalteromonas luteoviolacea]AOT09103.1 GCN5 family acetyltransferase [Pseudoalteromonas luteoviolacea]AOT14016.1 GCN5 family acetyltransferase [Pseudoalteromonas luteoviolacea]AOT18931.1 GCN5 family acetyltransferase [Pseudoalteromonas luteoviolacea]KKE85282.1 hypothetical protein N479_26150 [Pseudoalteromonas luteoviolacea S4054]KZN71067.1 hypothetical protein N481_19920 [Pseudoalteromonas luteoviolacea S4047-1]